MNDKFKEARDKAWVNTREDILSNKKECPRCSDLMHGFDAGSEWADGWWNKKYEGFVATQSEIAGIYFKKQRELEQKLEQLIPIIEKLKSLLDELKDIKDEDL